MVYRGRGVPKHGALIKTLIPLALQEREVNEAPDLEKI